MAEPIHRMFGIPAAKGREIAENIRAVIEDGITDERVLCLSSMYQPHSMYAGVILGAAWAAQTYGHGVCWDGVDDTFDEKRKDTRSGDQDEHNTNNA